MDRLPPYSLPWDLHPLLPDGDGTGRTLPCALQPGRLVVSDKGAGEPAFWLSDETTDFQVWDRLLAEHGHTEFWPLLLWAPDRERWPWAMGDVSFDNVTSPADHEPEVLLREWWHRHVVPQSVDTAPFGERWPDRPASTPLRDDPDRKAREVGRWYEDDADTWLGMVTAGSSADAVTAIGWLGAAKHTNDVAQISAVLRDWERRYGVRVVALGGYLLKLSVSAPPRDHDDALRLAAEHFAFCPTPLRWSMGVTLAGYADELMAESVWIFSWE